MRKQHFAKSGKESSSWGPGMVEQRQASPLGPSEFLTHRIHKPSKTCFMLQFWGGGLSVHNYLDKNQPFVPVWNTCIFIPFTPHKDPRRNVRMVITISQARKRRHSDVKSLADKGSDTEWCNGDLNPGRLIPEPGSCLVWDGTCPEMAERESPFSLLSLTISADQQSDPRLPPHPPSPLPSLWRLCLLSPWLCGFAG